MAASRHECSICMDSFKNPKLISCHHSFCYKCLEDYVEVNLHNGCFDCPICRTSIHLPESGISGFQTNFYIDTDSNEKFPCEICGPKNVASRRCLDCEENLCQSCCFVHEKLKVSRHHKISDLVTLDPEMKGKMRQRVFCDQHSEEEIKLVCQDCKVPICLMCKAVEHDTHPTKSLADVIARVKMTLDTKLNQCSDKLRCIKASTVKGEELDRSINDAEHEELKAADDQCSQLHKAIDQEAAKFKDKIKNIYRLLKEQNAVFRRYMEEEFKSCSNIKDIAQNLRDKGTDIEIIKKGPDIEQLISAAIVKIDTTSTIRVDSKLFSPAKIIAGKLIALIGILQDSTDAEEISRKEREEQERKEKEEREKKEKDLRILQQELLPIGEKITVYLTYIYNCGYFCVQKEDSCIDQITEELQKDCKTKSAPNMELLKTGQFCAGLFSADKCWTRAKINDIKDSEPKIELLSVDYGDVERVLSKDIRWLSENTAAAPAQCIKCSLHGIQPLETEIQWSSASAEAFAKIVKDVPLIAVTRTHCDETCDADLCLVSDPTISISDKLIQQGLVRSLIPVESYLEENEEEEEEEVEEEEVDAFCPDPITLPDDKTWDVHVTFINDSTNSVMMRFVGESYSDQLNQFENLLEQEFKKQKSEPVTEGMICVAHDDELYHRVHVESIVDKKVVCFFVDHGDKNILTMEQLRPLDAAINKKLPYQAVPVSLYGLEEVAENMTVLSKLCELALGKTCIAEPVNRNDSFSVILYDTTGDSDININEEILKVVGKEERDVTAAIGDLSLVDIAAKLSTETHVNQQIESLSEKNVSKGLGSEVLNGVSKTTSPKQKVDSSVSATQGITSTAETSLASGKLDSVGKDNSQITNSCKSSLGAENRVENTSHSFTNNTGQLTAVDVESRRMEPVLSLGSTSKDIICLFICLCICLFFNYI